MIKILKDGERPKEYKTIFKTTCYKCMCEFEFEREDCDYLDRNIDWWYIQITCPCCKRVLQRTKEILETRVEEI